ncbi:MAG: hypothetical protein KKD17_00420 [Nanoarchaeota archaeon]|nr:hypothetical protein [Nanoarchaeota archaeon]
MFSRLCRLFRKNRAHKYLMDEYSAINKLADALHKQLKTLRAMQKDIVETKIAYSARSGKATGVIGLRKTDFIEEKLINDLKWLSSNAEQRFTHACETIESTEPVSPSEKLELQQIADLLNNINDTLPKLENIMTVKDERDKALAIEAALRNVTNLCKEFHLLRRRRRKLAKEVLENEISPLVRRVYESRATLKGEHSMNIFAMTEHELRDLEREARHINSCNDPRYKIEFRKWWQRTQRPEVDFTTPLKDPHINVMMKLDGPERKIHLLLKAA